MRTKDKILKKALHLFNEKGIDQVSIRALAEQHLGISHGNLRYHFKSKEVIIVQLYHNMLEELNSNIEQKNQPSQCISHVLNRIKAGFEIQYKYKFISINLVEICRKIEAIHNQYRELKQRRWEEFRESVKNLSHSGYVKPDSEEELRSFFTVYNILGNFWAIEADLQGEVQEKDLVSHYFRVNCNMIIPHLTEKGLAEFNQYFASKSNVIEK